MKSYMTIAQIETEHQNEWILLGGVKTDEAMQILGGIVMASSEDRDKIYLKALELRPENGAIHCTKSLPSNTAIVL